MWNSEFLQSCCKQNSFLNSCAATKWPMEKCIKGQSCPRSVFLPVILSEKYIMLFKHVFKFQSINLLMNSNNMSIHIFHTHALLGQNLNRETVFSSGWFWCKPQSELDFCFGFWTGIGSRGTGPRTRASQFWLFILPVRSCASTSSNFKKSPIIQYMRANSPWSQQQRYQNRLLVYSCERIDCTIFLRQYWI